MDCVLLWYVFIKKKKQKKNQFKPMLLKGQLHFVWT